jgi:hypothetical protein
MSAEPGPSRVPCTPPRPLTPTRRTLHPDCVPCTPPSRWPGPVRLLVPCTGLRTLHPSRHPDARHPYNSYPAPIRVPYTKPCLLTPTRRTLHRSPVPCTGPTYPTPSYVPYTPSLTLSPLPPTPPYPASPPSSYPPPAPRTLHPGPGAGCSLPSPGTLHSIASLQSRPGAPVPYTTYPPPRTLHRAPAAKDGPFGIWGAADVARAHKERLWPVR